MGPRFTGLPAGLEWGWGGGVPRGTNHNSLNRVWGEKGGGGGGRCSPEDLQVLAK